MLRLDFYQAIRYNAFSVICHSSEGGSQYDYVIYYFHSESQQNLDEAAKKNHSTTEAVLVSAGSFDELVNAFNSIPSYIEDVYIYMHGDESELCFYTGLYYSAEDIANSFNTIDISGDVYLFSCKGGRGDLASTIAKTSNCAVIASIYKVSFGDGSARCGWWNYFTDVWNHGTYSWYIFHPDGSKEATSYFFIIAQ